MVTERTEHKTDDRSTNRRHLLASPGAAGSGGCGGGGSSQWAGLWKKDEQRVAVTTTSPAETTVKYCRVASFEGDAFAASSPKNPLREDSINSTLNLSGNAGE